MSTQGRLKRHFPGSAVSIPLAVFNDPDLHFSLADALARMGIEEVRDMKPMVKKASQMHIEERDTTNPAIVTDFLTTILCALGERVQVPVLEKNTREQVSWRNARMPWRRSPLWLLARITIHTICSRAGETHVYKQFMVFFMSSLLDVAVSLEMPCETLYCMVAKISGRLKKLGNDARDCLRGRVGTAMSTAAQRIEASWKKASQVLDATLSMRETSQFWRKDQYGSYPNMEAFINSIDSRDTDAASLDFKPSWSVPRHQESELPKALFSGKDQEAAFQLLAFERWVSTCLDHWLEMNIDANETPGRLLDVIKIYHQKAAASYARNPEATSLMLLTIMELWVACDKSACKVHGLLQKYAHEIPGEVLQSLILPFKRDMERLRCIENYLEERKLMASERNPSIFSSFGESNSFAVQFFQNSAEHGNLKKDIETWAEAERKRKREEFRTKLQAYESHTAKAAGRQHEYFARVNYKTGHEYQVHSRYCQRCYHKKEAKNLTIEVHEWPLPSDDLAAQNVVFELKVPTAIERWRDAAAYMISSVLKSTSRHSYEMGKEDALSDYLAQYYYCQKSKRFGLVSTTKSHRRTHRKLKTLGTASEGEVLLKSGLKFRYYDNVLCPCSSLRPFMFRPPESPNGKSANHIISQQSECPEHLSLEEFRAMAALPCGYRVQWLNILTQLRMPVLNFTNKDVLQILLQVSRQVGPPEDSVYRAGHQFPSRENFAIACVEGLEAALDKMKENWESYHAFFGAGWLFYRRK
ncbi:hypothetical protein ISF_02012 [Cordyceps fumosorosea ARSEF 2679]|uniref:DUF6606 domain-containing protein n=1 Tax=Cordyceps fumosorosea (strain ARSEF 2679) TaxID=1081104 RepID=A0A168CJQ4_CORFA|nr:hypothetical protein ISF_02012 [Cordyceps fumosorosea ARSEF 2679]OAA71461.1 hypothetical protein ISF_02012 [Cordyceps fumosorosea ARSEF 2679]